MKRKTSPTVHRIVLTHGREGVPKFIREDTEQFFEAVTRRKSKTFSVAKPILSNDFQSSYQINFDAKQKEKTQSTISLAKPIPPMLVPPPPPPSPPPPAPVRTSSSSRRAKAVSSASLCVHQPTLPPIIPSPSSSIELSTPMIESVTPLPSLSRQFRHGEPIDQDVFRRAYERAISVARSRLLFRDPYSLTRANATHGVLYSYYDHTPMCIFSHGNTCTHRQDGTVKKKVDRKTKGNYYRKQIFDDVVVENYLPYEKPSDVSPMN